VPISGFARLRARIRSIFDGPGLPVLVCVLLALGAVAAGAIAATGSDDPADAVDSSSPAMRHAFEQAQDQIAEAEAYRNSSAGRAERADSRDDFDHQADDQALATARAEFPGLVSSPPLEWPPLGEGQQIDRYLSPHSAVVDLPGARSAVLQSDLPLRGETPGGDSAPLDMGLTDQGDSFEPKSTTTAVELPKSSDDEVRFPDQGLGLEVAGADATGAKLTQDKLFFPNALTDTDVVAEPTPGGAEISLVLRSPDSPDQPALRFDLPGGAALRLADAPNTAEVVRDGKRLALVDPATAVDSQGKAIPVTYRVDGDRLVMELGDTSDVAWPVMVDPTTYVYDNNGQSVAQGSTGFSWPGWQQITSRTPQNNPCPYPAGQPFYECKQTDGSITIWGFVGVQPAYVGYDYGAFRKPARSGTYIYSFHAANMSHTANQSISFGGICSTNCAAWLTGHWWTPLDKATNTVNKTGASAMRTNSASFAGQTDYYCYDPTGAAPSTSCALSTTANAAPQVNTAAEWGMLMTGIAPTAQPHTAMGGAATLSADNKPPSIVSATHSTAPNSSAWVQNYTDTVTLRAADNNAEINNTYTYGSDTNVNGDHLTGVGLGTVTVSGPGAGGSQAVWCSTTTNYDECPQVFTFPGITYTAPEGTSTYTPSSADIVGNGQNGTGWTVKVDRTAPTGSFTNVPTYTNGTASITGTISDSLSGPQDTKVQYQAPGSSTWVDACARQATTSSFSCNWNTAGLTDGTYKVRAELRDNTAGGGPNVGYVPSADIVVDHTAPAQLTDVAPSAGSNEYDDKLDESGMTETNFVQSDALSGVAQTTLEYNSATDGTANGQWVPAEAAPATGDGATSTLWATASVPDGLHRVRAKTQDNAANERFTYYLVVASARRKCTTKGGCYVGFGYGNAGPAPSRTEARPACTDPNAMFADPNGNDNSPTGSSTQPFNTVRKLVDSLTPAKPTGCLKAGVYRVNDPDYGGSPSGGYIQNLHDLPRLTLQNVPGAAVTIQGFVYVGGVSQPSGDDLHGENITVRGLTLNGRNTLGEDCKWAVSSGCGRFSPEIKGNNVQLLENDITTEGNATDADTQTNCIIVKGASKGRGRNNLIKNNVIHNCGWPTHAVEYGTAANNYNDAGGHWHGIYVSTGINTEISYNIFYGNGDRGIQVYPAASGTKIHHNTLHDNGFGINIGGAQEGTGDCESTDDPSNWCYPDHTDVYANVVTDSRAGHDSRYDQSSETNNIYSYNIPDGLKSGAQNHIRATNCSYLSWDKTRGYDPSTSGDLYWEDLTDEDPMYVNVAAHNFKPRNSHCAGFGAIPSSYRSFGLRDRMTTPNFSGTSTGYNGTTAVVAAKLRSPTRHPIETGVTNKAPCSTSSTPNLNWVVYISWYTKDGNFKKKCATKNPLGQGVEKPYSAMIRSDKRDVVSAPNFRGTSRVILDRTKNKYAPTGGVASDAFVRTGVGGAKVGGSWTGISFLASLANPQGGGAWTTPTATTSFELTSFENSFHYSPYAGSTSANPWTSFCAYGPNQAGCP
jgi:parallel beta-helix repeat protein